MKLPLLWLNDYIKFKLKPDQLAEVLTLSGSEVEGIDDWQKKLAGVVVGQIKTITKHPQASKLSLVKVGIGQRGQRLSIVCGASNIAVGQKVPVALVGTTLPNGLTIELAKIRGRESQGMLCAEDELCLGTDHTGIIILSNKAKIGQSVASALDLIKPVLDLDLTPNRGDCFSIIGLAREVSVLTKSKLKLPVPVKLPKASLIAGPSNLIVKVLDQKLCPKYVARIVRGVKIKESPVWLKSRLLAAGVRPINNVVDVTNFVLLELGQPLHAFDASLLSKDKQGQTEIVVRRAKASEKMFTLDDQERELTDQMLVITDCQKPIALAGVMGGANTEINNQTTDIIIESAQFLAGNIRQTSKQLNLQSESSLRFERGIDWQMTDWAADRAAQLIVELAGGKIISEAIKVVGQAPKSQVINLSLDYLNDLLGAKVSQAKVTDILTSLGCQVQKKNKQELAVTPPTWRYDITVPADLVEEVGRIYGYNKMKPTNLTAELKPLALGQKRFWENKIREILAGSGFSEMYNYSFHGQNVELVDANESTDYFTVANPLNPDQQWLRQSLLPRLFDNLQKNIKEFPEVKIFELGQIFLVNNKSEALPQEINKLGLAYGTKNLKPEIAINLFKGIVELMVKELNLSDCINYGQDLPKKIGGCDIFIKINLGKNNIGEIIFKPDVNYGFCELAITDLIKKASLRKQYQPVNKYPAVKRDLAVAVRDLSVVTDKLLYYQDIKKLVLDLSKTKFNSIIKEVEYLSTYPLADNQRSVAFRLIFQSAERTLESGEVENVLKEIVGVLKERFNAKLR